jgi:hypothetical protein
LIDFPPLDKDSPPQCLLTKKLDYFSETRNPTRSDKNLRAMFELGFNWEFKPRRPRKQFGFARSLLQMAMTDRMSLGFR